MANEGEKNIVDYFNKLPIETIANIISFTTPVDACRFATLSTYFNVAANSNIVWDRFLPSNYREIFLNSNVQLAVDRYNLAKKLIFRIISEGHLLIDNGLMSFQMDKSTAKKCITLSARKLNISWAENPNYWAWHGYSKPESRFREVAMLNYVWWLEIRGEVKMSMLSPNTKYCAYLVFQVTSDVWRLYDIPVEAEVKTPGGEVVAGRVYLDPRRGGIFDHVFETTDEVFDPWPPEENVRLPKKRKDEWVEVEIGKFYTTDNGGGVVKFSLREVKAGISKGGLVVEGIEIRPIV